MTDPDLAPYPSLPPIGGIGEFDHAAAASYLSRLSREARVARSAYDDQVDRNRSLFAYGNADNLPPVEGEVVIPEIQTAVIAATDIQTKEPPAATLEPVERADAPLYFWAGPQEVGLGMGLSPAMVAHQYDARQQVQPPQPIPPTLARLLRRKIQSGNPQYVVAPVVGTDPATGAPVSPGTMAPYPWYEQMVMLGEAPQDIADEWVVEVSDRVVAETYQVPLDVDWERARMDRRWRSNLLTTNVDGFSVWLYEYDDEEQLHGLRPLSPVMVYLDPLHEDIADMSYAGIDLVIDREAAKRAYPDLAEAIDEHARAGQPARPDENTRISLNADRLFERATVTLRIFWIRNQPCPYPPEEAVSRGLVEQRDVPAETADMMGEDGTPAHEGAESAAVEQGEDDGGDAEDDRRVAPDGVGQDGDGPAADDGRPGGPAGEGRAGAGGAGAGEIGGDLRPETGDGDGGIAPPAVATRPAYFLAGTETEVTPTDPAWPTYLCLRQITSIAPAGLVADDRVCEHWDIPLIHNVNIPVLGQPYGQGEPQRLASMQQARSRMMTAIVDHTETLAHPMIAMSQSMYAATEAAYAEGRSTPGKVIIVPDMEWERAGGKVDVASPPPPLPEATVSAQAILKQEITEQSGHSEVLQGRAGANIKSGKAIELLQSSASSMIGFKSARTGDAVWRLAMLMNHVNVHRRTFEDLAAIVGKWQDHPHILAAIHDRALAMQWNVSVVVTSGNGSLLQAKAQKAMGEREAGLISDQTYYEESGRDARKERSRMTQEAAEKMKAAAGMGPGMQPMPMQAPPGAAAGMAPPVPGGGARTFGQG